MNIPSVGYPASISQMVANLAQNVQNEPDSPAKARLVTATRAYILEVREYMAATIVHPPRREEDGSD